MPANYALHRFGSHAIQRLSMAQQRPVQRFRRLYNGGVHGQDLFFYFAPMGNAPVKELYGKYNAMTGAEFFAQAAEHLKTSPSEGGTACLYGLLAHYCLMSSLAPMFAAETAGGKVTRTELEVELDRYLLGLDGKTPAHTQDFSEQFKMTRGECMTMSGFFPPATAANIYRAMKSMMGWSRRMAAEKRGFAKLLLGLTKGDFRQQMMPDHANHKCMHLDLPMLECYEQALDKYEEMAQQLTLFCRNGTPLGEEFAGPFV